MKIANSKSKICDASTKLITDEQANANQNNSIFTEKRFQLYSLIKNEVRSGIEPQTLSCRGDGFNSISSGIELPSC